MLAAYVTSFAAIVLSFVVHVHATVSATVPISFPCAAYQPSTEHGVTHSHPRFMVVGALSLMFVVSALALRRADQVWPQRLINRRQWRCLTHAVADAVARGAAYIVRKLLAADMTEGVTFLRRSVRAVPTPNKLQTHLWCPKGPVRREIVTVLGEGAGQRNKRSNEKDCNTGAHDSEWFWIVGLWLRVNSLCGSYSQTMCTVYHTHKSTPSAYKRRQGAAPVLWIK
ncbi:hypothetical protein C8F04DRAFT_1172996 [Mycena alexandri]|uniref:Uncharacterized protein n=1 Tax=Mycena alexandri TaxID=1745969 RepID=A0AAD6XFE5_9AGAR|nr:hypothetical protein C8F04DRAFT_1172996 [Mycena alexandri]